MSLIMVFLVVPDILNRYVPITITPLFINLLNFSLLLIMMCVHFITILLI